MRKNKASLWSNPRMNMFWEVFHNNKKQRPKCQRRSFKQVVKTLCWLFVGKSVDWQHQRDLFSAVDERFWPFTLVSSDCESKQKSVRNCDKYQVGGGQKRCRGGGDRDRKLATTAADCWLVPTGGCFAQLHNSSDQLLDGRGDLCRVSNNRRRYLWRSRESALHKIANILWGWKKMLVPYTTQSIRLLCELGWLWCVVWVTCATHSTCRNATHKSMQLDVMQRTNQCNSSYFELLLVAIFLSCELEGLWCLWLLI